MNDLVPLNQQNAVEYFKPNGLDPIIEKIRNEVKSFLPDISTDKGRKEISSMARKVASSKVAMDDLGKDLVSGLKAQTSAIDAERKRMRDIMDALRDETRKPLTDWEEAEEARTNTHKQKLEEISKLLVLPLEPSVAELTKRLDSTADYRLWDFQEFSELAIVQIETAEKALIERIAYVKDAQDKVAELERLRAAERERLRKEQEDKLREEMAAKAKADAEAFAKTEIERAEREKREALEKVERAEANRIAAAKKSEDDAKALAEKTERDRVTAIEIANREREAAVQAERDRQEAKRQQEAVETAKREANLKHVKKINNEALEAVNAIIETSKKTESNPAKAIIEAIARGNIPHVKITY